MDRAAMEETQAHLTLEMEVFTTVGKHQEELFLMASRHQEELILMLGRHQEELIALLSSPG